MINRFFYVILYKFRVVFCSVIRNFIKVFIFSIDCVIIKTAVFVEWQVKKLNKIEQNVFSCNKEGR